MNGYSYYRLKFGTRHEKCLLHAKLEQRLTRHMHLLALGHYLYGCGCACTCTGALPRPQSRAEAEPLRAYAQPNTPGNRTHCIMKTSVGRRKRMPSPLCRSLREWKTQEGDSDRNMPQFTLAEQLVRSVPQDRARTSAQAPHSMQILNTGGWCALRQCWVPFHQASSHFREHFASTAPIDVLFRLQ